MNKRDSRNKNDSPPKRLRNKPKRRLNNKPNNNRAKKNKSFSTPPNTMKIDPT